MGDTKNHLVRHNRLRFSRWPSASSSSPTSRLVAGEETFHAMTNTTTDFNPYEDPFTRRLAKKKSRQLVGKYGFSETDQDDIKQDIYLHVFQRWSSYDPAEGHHHKFITAVVERYVANFVRDRCAIKRYEGEHTSLETPLPETSQALSVGDALSDAALDARHCRQRRSDKELSELRMDLQTALDELPPQWSEVLELRRSLTVTEISEQLGIPRTTINSWIRQARERFIEFGSDEYLNFSSSDRA